MAAAIHTRIPIMIFDAGGNPITIPDQMRIRPDPDVRSSASGRWQIEIRGDTMSGDGARRIDIDRSAAEQIIRAARGGPISIDILHSRCRGIRGTIQIGETTIAAIINPIRGERGNRGSEHHGINRTAIATAQPSQPAGRSIGGSR